MLWELGHWQPGLTLACCRRILRELPDFKLETSELSNLWRSRGHGFELGVKCHPEMAGCGIEYCWGKVSLYARVTVCACVFVCLLMFVYVCVCCLQGKYEFRNFINTKTTKRAKLIASVSTALGRTDFEVCYTKKRGEAPLFTTIPHEKVSAVSHNTRTHLLTNTHARAGLTENAEITKGHM